MSIDAMDALRTRMNAMDAKKNAKNAMDAKKNANERYRPHYRSRIYDAFRRLNGSKEVMVVWNACQMGAF